MGHPVCIHSLALIFQYFHDCERKDSSDIKNYVDDIFSQEFADHHGIELQRTYLLVAF